MGVGTQYQRTNLIYITVFHGFINWFYPMFGSCTYYADNIQPTINTMLQISSSALTHPHFFKKFFLSQDDWTTTKVSLKVNKNWAQQMIFSSKQNQLLSLHTGKSLLATRNNSIICDNINLYEYIYCFHSIAAT